MRWLLACSLVVVASTAVADCPVGYTCEGEDCPAGYTCEGGNAEPTVPEDGPWYQEWFQTVLDALAELWEQFLCALKRFFCWIVDTAAEAGIGFIETLLGVFPDMSAHAGAIAAAASWLGIANMFLPLAESFAMVLAYATFVIAVIVVKWVLKLIPTIG